MTQEEIFEFAQNLPPAEVRPRQGGDALRSIQALLEEASPVPDDLIEAADKWLENQVMYWHEAQLLVQDLEKRHPTPTPQQVVEGASFPPQHGKEWWMILTGVPLAEQLPQSVMAARDFLGVDDS
jgi:hypothetical protein